MRCRAYAWKHFDHENHVDSFVEFVIFFGKQVMEVRCSGRVVVCPARDARYPERYMKGSDSWVRLT